MNTCVMRIVVRALVFLSLACPVIVHAQTTVKYVHTDALGSVVAMTNASGAVVEATREYEPYGQQLTPALQDGPGYTGHVQDAATGLTYMQQRYYDPQLGLFLSVDPVAAYSKKGILFNRYWYANNNPYRFNDPDGRAVETPWDVANVALDVASLSANVAAGNWGSAAVDFVSLAYDGTATVVPGLPAGGGVALKIGRGLSATYSRISSLGGGVRQLNQLAGAIGNLARAGSDVAIQTRKGAGHALDMSVRMDPKAAQAALQKAGFEVGAGKDGTVVLTHEKSGVSATMYTRTSDGQAGISFQYKEKTIAKVSLRPEEIK